MIKYLLSCSLFLLLFPADVSSQTFTYSNLPIVVLDTDGAEIPDDPKIKAHMGIIWNGDGDTNFLTDPFNNYDGYIGIEIRGSSSQMFPKKQYGFETWDSEGEGIDASLLGMPAEEDWILSAPYNDKTLMRDMLAYSLGQSLGHYAPRSKYCELVINGTYQGVFMLREKIKRNKNRVDIKKMDPDKISGAAVTGGYLIKIDKATGDDTEGWQSDFLPNNNQTGQRVTFLYDYPKAANIAPEQKTYIHNYVESFETALAGENFADPVNGYRKYADVGSFIDFFLITELTKNVDGYRISTYLNKQNDANGGKLRMGPIWDFNLGFGNVDYCTQGNHEGWVYKFNDICSTDGYLVPFWWEKLHKDKAYEEELYGRWTALRANQLSEATIHHKIDSAYALLDSGAQQRNFERWPEVMGQYIWPNYYVGESFDEEVNWLKSWITARLAWMDQELAPDVVTGIPDEKRKENSILVAPNPSTENIVIRTNQTIEWVKITGMDGQTESYSAPSFTTKLKGLVVVEVKTAEGVKRQKVVVQ